jgi:hypothetical protein
MGLVTKNYWYYYSTTTTTTTTTTTAAAAASNKKQNQQVPYYSITKLVVLLFHLVCCLNLYNISTCYFTWGLKFWQLYCWKNEVLWNVMQGWLVKSYRHFKAQECLDIQCHAMQQNSSHSQITYQLQVLTL